MQDWTLFIIILSLSILFLVVFIYTGNNKESYRYERESIDNNMAATSPCINCPDCGGEEFDSESCKLNSCDSNLSEEPQLLLESSCPFYGDWEGVGNDVDQQFKDCDCRNDQYSDYPSYYTMKR